MKISDMTWMQVEAYLREDDRCILPLGSTEQHAYMSLSVDSILAGKLAADVADPMGIPVYPVLPYGLAPYWRAYPGSVSLRINTYLHLIEDILDNLYATGFRRILIMNGHGGNSPAMGLVSEWTSDHTDCRVKFHNWWIAPKTMAKVLEIDTDAAHASWMENFPWTRLDGVDMPATKKAMADKAYMDMQNPEGVRAYLQDGSMGGDYQKPDQDMLAIWEIAIQETRALLEENWG